MTVSPNTVSYNTVMRAWALSGASNAAEKVSDIFAKCDRPNTTSYKLMIEAYSHANIQCAEEMLLQMEELAKDEKSGVKLDRDAMISLIIKGSAERAERILQKMEYYYRNGMESLKPDTSCYNTVMKAHEDEGNH